VRCDAGLQGDAFQTAIRGNAQGGIASVLAIEDSFESHVEDTLKTGCGLCDREVVERVVRQGPETDSQMDQWGTEFDRVDGKIDITREGGHSHPRIAHAHGDSTGRGLAEALIRKVKQQNNINIIENFFSIDLLTGPDGGCLGIIGYRPRAGYEIIWAAATILATGVRADFTVRQPILKSPPPTVTRCLSCRGGTAGYGIYAVFIRRRCISPVHPVP